MENLNVLFKIVIFGPVEVMKISKITVNILLNLIANIGF